MSTCGTCGGGFTGECMCGAPAPHFTSPDDLLGCTLADSLAGVVDGARDIKTRLGFRTHSVWLVWTRWSGGRRGRGVEEVHRETELLPTPDAFELSAIQAMLVSGGRDEQGTVRVRGISVRYTEDELRGLGAAGQKVPDDQSFYWEFRFRQPRGENPIRRRFVVSGMPERKMDSLEWVIDLVRASEDRARNGAPQG